MRFGVLFVVKMTENLCLFVVARPLKLVLYNLRIDLKTRKKYGNLDFIDCYRDH